MFTRTSGMASARRDARLLRLDETDTRSGGSGGSVSTSDEEVSFKEAFFTSPSRSFGASADEARARLGRAPHRPSRSDRSVHHAFVRVVTPAISRADRSISATSQPLAPRFATLRPWSIFAYSSAISTPAFPSRSSPDAFGSPRVSTRGASTRMSPSSHRRPSPSSRRSIERVRFGKIRGLEKINATLDDAMLDGGRAAWTLGTSGTRRTGGASKRLSDQAPRFRRDDSCDARTRLEHPRGEAQKCVSIGRDVRFRRRTESEGRRTGVSVFFF